MAEKKKAKDRKPIAQQQPEAEFDLDFVELFYRWVENWVWILLTALVAALIAGIISFKFVTPMYEATSKLYVMNSKDSAVNLSDLQIGTALTNDYIEVFYTWEVKEMVIQNLDLDYSYEELSKMVSVSNPSNTRVLYITAASADPQEATDIANEYAAVAQKFITTTMGSETPSLFSEALRPTNPVSPHKKRNVILGFIGGAILAMLIVAIRFLMDDKIKTGEDIRKYSGLPVLAVVPLMEDASKKSRSHSRRQ